MQSRRYINGIGDIVTFGEAISILDKIQYKHWKFCPHKNGDLMYFNLLFWTPTGANGTLEPQHSRKWILSEHMTESEIVQTAFKAILTAEEHETREQFLYENVAVFNPHIAVSVLKAICGMQDRRQ